MLLLEMASVAPAPPSARGFLRAGCKEGETCPEPVRLLSRTFSYRHYQSFAGGRFEQYAVVNLINEHGDAKLTDLLWALANCHEWRSDGAHRCRAVYEGCCSRSWL